MYDIRQFKPSLYVLLLMGISGFALAAQSSTIWVVGVGGVLLNAWLVATDRFKPLSRIVANLVTVLAMGFIVFQVRRGGFTPILLIGQFLVLLHLVKLFEQRANRDYAQLLVLSLLLMVAASINTASLVFGLLLVAYLFLSLYCCLLFHLKVEADQAKAAIAVPEEKLNPMTLRQDQRYLPRSMRRLTALVSAVAVTTAVAVFLFFPRGTGAGMLGQMQFQPSQTLTGFSEQVSFQQVARITQNQERVAYVKVWHNEQPLRGSRTLLLRGITLDTYSGEGDSPGTAWRWSRSQDRGERPYSPAQGSNQSLAPHLAPDVWRQQVMLDPTGTNVLFAMPGVSSISFNRDIKLRYSPRDRAIQTVDPLLKPLEYEVVSTNELGPAAGISGAAARVQQALRDDRLVESGLPSPVRDYALRPDVSGVDGGGAGLAAQRGLLRLPHVLDGDIARNIEKHLREKFTYTLDLTDARRIRGQDPVVAFLYDLKRGHCEYFAAAMTLMCQSLGIQARMVIGFKCDEFNEMGGYYIVRQAHAHAWAEVLTVDGWQSFDPTSGRMAEAAEKNFWMRLKHMFNFLEYTWAKSVVAYDQDSRLNLIQTVEAKMTNTAIRSGRAVGGFGDWLDSAQFWFVSSKLLTGLMGLMVAALLAAVAWFLYERWKLYRLARRIGLEGLPLNDRKRLARQLGFYDDLLRLLEHRQIVPPKHQTPLEFSNSLTFLPSEVYDTVRRLTNLFYRIRFGEAQLSYGQQRRLANVIGRLGTALENGKDTGG